jgi:ribose transport system substrate-binding protein
MNKVALAISGLLTLVLVGCGGASGSDQGSGTEEITIGFSQRQLAGSDWYKQLIQGAQDEAKKQGASIQVADAGNDAVRQNSDVQNFVTRGVQAVIMNPSDPRGVAPAVNELEGEGIPLVVVNSNLDKSLESKAFCYVAENQPETAAMSGRAVAEAVEKKFGSSDALKLAVVGGFPGEVVTELRQEGFLKGYNEYFEENSGPKTEVLPTRYGNWLPDKALAPTREIATANPDLKVVFSQSDVMLPGIEQGLRQAGLLNKVVVGSYDGDMSVVKKMVDDPDGPVQAVASNAPYLQGVEAVRMAVAAVKGDESACSGGTNYIDSVLVTPENAEKYYDPDKPFVY